MAKSLAELSLLDVVPASITADRQVAAAATAIDPELRAVSGGTALLPILSRLDELPEAWLDLLAWQWHADAYDSALTVEQKRRIVERTFLVHRYKGTFFAVKQVLEGLGYESELIEDTGQHHVFDVMIRLEAGGDIGAISERAARYVDSAKPASRHLRRVINYAETGGSIAPGMAVMAGAVVEVWPLTSTEAETSGRLDVAAAMEAIATVEIRPCE